MPPASDFGSKVATYFLAWQQVPPGQQSPSGQQSALAQQAAFNSQHGPPGQQIPSGQQDSTAAWQQGPSGQHAPSGQQLPSWQQAPSGQHEVGAASALATDAVNAPLKPAPDKTNTAAKAATANSLVSIVLFSFSGIRLVFM
jgi:hypothetical protein